MSGNEAIEPVRASIRVPLATADAFKDFVCDINRWWPLSYTCSLDRFAEACIEPIKGGQWYEVDTEGRRTSWGEVRAFEPPDRVVLSYAIGPDWQPGPPDEASEIEIRFVPEHGITNLEQPATRIEVTHADLARHGDGAGAMRRRLASERGWTLILASFARRHKA
ncbi:MAG: SRPBCC family protein [Hyphomicrobiaceae bacterium]|nr:SRPBCC family protein [Hyphomicrobiaceae bacterium]